MNEAWKRAVAKWHRLPNRSRDDFMSLFKQELGGGFNLRMAGPHIRVTDGINYSDWHFPTPSTIDIMGESIREEA